MKGRRSFLKNMGALGIATSAPFVGRTRATVDVSDALNKNVSSSTVDQATGSDHCRGVAATSDKVFQGSSLKIINVFHESTYGWQAHVALNSTGASVHNRGDQWESREQIDTTTFKAVNSTSSFYTPDPTEGFRGFEQHAGSDGSPTLPSWFEPAFDLAASTTVSLATSNPWTGVAAGALLSLNNLANSLRRDDGKHDINNGVEVQHTHKEDFWGHLPHKTQTDKMAHYQRFTLRTGDSPTDGHISIEGTFTGANHLVEKTNVGFDVYLWQDEDDGEVVTSDSGDTEGIRSIHPGELTQDQKEQYGVVSVSDGEVRDSDVRTTQSVNNQVQRISESIQGEVTKVALNPPTTIHVH